MSADKTLVKARRLAEDAEREVMTVPARVYSLLLDLALKACADGDESTARARRAEKVHAGLSATADYLEQTLATNYRSIDISLPEDVLNAAKDIRTSLRRLLDTLPTGEAVPATTIGQTADQITESLQEPVDKFLAALFKMVVEAEGARGRRGQSLDSAAVEQIGDISSRINLIAVNASIEAARVGEAGRGFAVIANEIQELSRKSEDAVRNIRKNII